MYEYMYMSVGMNIGLSVRMCVWMDFIPRPTMPRFYLLLPDFSPRLRDKSGRGRPGYKVRFLSMAVR